MKLKFIDLFAGLGGFHLALQNLGNKCVFASEINKELANTYKENFDLEVKGDIRKIQTEDIPVHDILCAGFPCQPFSQAGKQQGLNDEKNGIYLDEIKRIVAFHKPKYILLENVPNIKKHDKEKTWNVLESIFKNELGYQIDEKVLSPHQFGIPQIRKRLYIVGAKKDLSHFSWPVPSEEITSVNSILESNPKKFKPISQNQINCLNIWQEIISKLPANEPLPGFPIWTTDYKATYPFEKATPYYYNKTALKDFKGTFGKDLSEVSENEILNSLPIYARTAQRKFPYWKVSYIKRNREFLLKNENIFKPYIEKLKTFPFSWQKFEWNCGDTDRDIFKNIIQFRASGIRVKLPNYFPALVVTSTQIPIIGKYKRYITLNEAAKLQSMENLRLPESDTLAYRALGNAVNAHIVELIAKNLIK